METSAQMLPGSLEAAIIGDVRRTGTQTVRKHRTRGDRRHDMAENIISNVSKTTEQVPAEFRAAFEITRYVVFEVSYHTLGNNAEPYFSTTAGRLNRPKTDYAECGQCQSRILREGAARRFWQKWDGKHLSVLTDEERAEVWADVQELGDVYNYVIITSEKFGNEDSRDILFSDVVALSKQEIKRQRRTA